MANIATEQLNVIAQHLSELEDQIEQLIVQNNTMREEAHKLLIEANKKSYKTIYGNFTRVAGRTTKTFTSAEYIAAKEALQIAQLRAENRGQFTTTVGEESLRFSPS